MPRWDVMWQYLIDQKLPTLTPQEAKQRVGKKQWVLIDVRPTENHEEAHPEGSKSVPLFKKVQWGQTTFMGFVRAAAMAVNGVTPMAVNEQFKDELERATGGKGAILMCEAGGTMTPSSNFVTGKVSRSLKAAYQAIEQGKMKNVAHLDGGVYNWARLHFLSTFKPADWT
ncbi:hypothetical protein WJX84_009679 [Apatococcus fuscideae]|uniref:Rhodanese domain-containing protein n=1 Tax=Apatococcus fuscideae TaxID=2026836 RepID=A0AAW1T9A2_9CHLO